MKIEESNSKGTAYSYLDTGQVFKSNQGFYYIKVDIPGKCVCLRSGMTISFHHKESVEVVNAKVVIE